jgi:hypothetical protein
MRIEPTEPRYTVVRSGSGVTVTTRPRRNWLMLLFIGVWLGGWTIGGATALAQVLRPGEGRAFLFFWLAGWLCGELYAITVVLWQLTGREEITISSGNLEHRVCAGGLSRAREFTGANIKHLRASPQTLSPWMDQRSWMPPLFGAGHGAIAFDYGAKTYRIGAGLDEAEARLVLAEIGKYDHRMLEAGR